MDYCQSAFAAICWQMVTDSPGIALWLAIMGHSLVAKSAGNPSITPGRDCAEL